MKCMRPNYKISTACIVEYENKILMIKEEQNGKVCWDIPAGGLEMGETLEQGVIREVEEESGVKILDPVIKTVYEYIEKERITINFLYYSHVDIKNISFLKPQDTDIFEAAWFAKTDIEKLIQKREYENNLGKERLLNFLEGFKNNLTIVTITE